MVGPKKALQHVPKGIKLNKRKTKAWTKCANRGIGIWSVWFLWARLSPFLSGSSLHPHPKWTRSAAHLPNSGRLSRLGFCDRRRSEKSDINPCSKDDNLSRTRTTCDARYKNRTRVTSGVKQALKAPHSSWSFLTLYLPSHWKCRRALHG